MMHSTEIILKAKTYERCHWRRAVGTITVHKPSGNYLKTIIKDKKRHITIHLRKDELVGILKDLQN